MKNQIYQLVAFVNAYNKNSKQWESLHNITKVYVGKEGLKTAYFEFEIQQKEVQFYLQQNFLKYSDVRGKVELQIPHIHENGSLAYWRDKVLHSFNPSKI
jgi:hypothetical protein